MALIHLPRVAACALIVMLIGISQAGCGPSSSYRRFLRQNAGYYSEVASECDHLLVRDPTVGMEGARKLAADVKHLP